MAALVLVDAENVRRSTWPNVSRERLVELLGAWAEAREREALVVYDGPPPEVDAPPRVDLAGTERGGSADERLLQEARRRHEHGEGVELVTSDRELRALASPYVERTPGGGSFLRELLAAAG